MTKSRPFISRIVKLYAGAGHRVQVLHRFFGRDFWVDSSSTRVLKRRRPAIYDCLEMAQLEQARARRIYQFCGDENWLPDYYQLHGAYDGKSSWLPGWQAPATVGPLRILQTCSKMHRYEHCWRVQFSRRFLHWTFWVDTAFEEVCGRRYPAVYTSLLIAKAEAKRVAAYMPLPGASKWVRV